MSAIDKNECFFGKLLMSALPTFLPLVMTSGQADHVAGLSDQIYWNTHPKQSIYQLAGISRQVAERKVLNKRLLYPEATERVLRVIRAETKATEIFGNSEKALKWLQSPKDAFQGQSPLDFRDTDIGSEKFIEVLVGIAYGFSACIILIRKTITALQVKWSFTTSKARQANQYNA